MKQDLGNPSDNVARLRKLGDLPPPPSQEALRQRGAWARAIEFSRRHVWFLLIVVLPTLTAALYFGIVAADIYVSEARFVVRGAERPAGGSALNGILQTAGVASSRDESFSVHDYILSRDVVRSLSEAHALKEVLSRPEGDFIRRYPPPFREATEEQLYKTYRNFVHVTYEGATGISTLTVEAFRPGDALRLATALIKMSEELINRMNDRARADSLRFARQEIAVAEKRVMAAQSSLTEYRLRTDTLDPKLASGAALELIGVLSGERAAAQAALAEALVASPSSPQIAALRNRIAALERQIADERAKVVGPDASMTLLLSEYETLLLEQKFATRQLASATASLELARQESERQQLYLNEVVRPHEPDYPLYPRRFRAVFLVLVSALMLYGVLWLVSASVREHIGR